MMGKKIKTLIFLIFKCLISTVVVADYACPYPCLPPPIAGTTTTPATAATQTGSYPPPAYYSPPGGFLPNYPPGGGGGYGRGLTIPPPPDPILPYFPYYYRNGVHRPSDQTSSATRSTAWFVLAGTLAASFLSSSLFW